MNVFYEEDGDFKVGAVLSDNVASLQVEAAHGKRSKIKAANVLVRFEGGGLAEFMPEARKLADEIDLDFLWECCGSEEFSFEALARDYHGRDPSAVESAALLIRLHGAPMYFYKKGKGRYRAAPKEALAAALASVERKRREAEQQAAYVAQLTAFTLPEDFRPEVDRLLYHPDKASVQWKALEAACTALKLSAPRLMEKCSALASPHDYHLRRFLFENFPRGTAFRDPGTLAVPDDLPLAAVEAFSIDDAATTEIDDAFSVTPLPNGNVSVGIHIAAPALGVSPGGGADTDARQRLSTVYYPGGKITMFPDAVIERFSLAQGRIVPALSLYLEVTPDLAVVASTTRAERLAVAANLRHDELEAACGRAAMASGAVSHPFGPALTTLWRLATQLASARGLVEEEAEGRPEYSFYVDGERVRIVRRFRGTPVDRTVSELMIHANSTWGRDLARGELAAIYRVQNGGKVRMSTVPGGHDGLKVDSYAWSSSPLRRYVDLVNQRQLVALVAGTAPVYSPGGENLLAAMRDFEAAHEIYGQFQRAMERYWCLRWLLQEDIVSAPATVLRESLVRLDEVPLVARVPSLPALAPGRAVAVAISRIDLLDLTFHCEFAGVRDPQDATPANS